MYLVLIYDIALARDGEEHTKDARVLRNVFKICKKYLTHVQNSVFEGELSDPQLLMLKHELSKHLRKEKDSCILFRSRNDTWMKKEFLTEVVEHTTRFL